MTAESAAGILQIGNNRQRVINTINSHILILTSIKTFGILNRQIIQFSKQLLPNQTSPSWGSQFVKVTSRSHKATVSKFIIMFYCELCSPNRYQALYLLYKSSDDQRLCNLQEKQFYKRPPISKHYSWSKFLFEVNDHVQSWEDPPGIIIGLALK